MNKSRGFTLIEMALSLTLLGMVSALFAVVVIGAARPAAHALSALATDRTIDVMSTFLFQELRDARDSDIAVAAGEVDLTRPIGEALACADSGEAIYVADTAYAATRSPEAVRDHLAVLARGDTIWQQLPVTAVAHSHCPDGRTSALQLAVPAHTGRAAAIRVGEPVELRIYGSGGLDWFGLEPADHSSNVQPVAGPLVAGSAQFVRWPARLEVTLSPVGAPSTSLAVPLGSPP